MRPAILQAGRWGLVAVLAATLAAEARAQPIRLVPPGGNDAPAAAPAPAGQPQAAPGPIPTQANVLPVESPAAPSEGSAAPNGFMIQPLQAPDPSSAGLLDDGNGGLGTDMWQNTSRRQAVQALSVLPAPVPMPALRDLQRRLLLTIAEVPEGEAGTPSLLGHRIEQLYELGQVDAARQLATPKPPQLKDPVFLRLPVDAALLQNDLPHACDLISQGLRDDPAAYWQKASVLCRYTAKDIAGGDLALSLWRDGGGDDPAFNALAAALRGDSKVKLEGLGSAVSPLHFAMLRTSGRAAPKDMLEIASPAVLAALAGYDKAGTDLRLAATEEAVRLGALPASALGEVYAALDIPEAHRAALLGGKDSTPRAAAALYQAIKATPDPKTRADLMRRAFELALARDLLFPTAAALKPMLADIPVEESSIAAAAALIRLSLAGGDTGLARLWYNTMLTWSPERTGDVVARAWPLLLLSGAEGEWQNSRFEAWGATQDKLPVPERNARTALLLTLAEAAGITVPPERWDALLAPTAATGTRSGAPVTIWRNLTRASQARAKAETVALALALLGPHGSEMADAHTLATALGALRSVELVTEARQIALEAALLRGF